MKRAALSLVLNLAAAAAILCGAAGCAPADSALKEPAKSVLSRYLTIQAGLANDSTQGLAENAAAIAAAVKSDPAKTFPPDMAAEAETLAQAKDLKAAREAFKPFSATLVKYMSDNKVAGGDCHEVYCPMAEASWLQTGKDIRNPYYGKEMLDCGELKN
jgi:Cu(I)/Ag(I) efflux system membrane fusion protein